MTVTDPGHIERDLVASLALPLTSRDIARLDARVAAAITTPAPARWWLHLRRPRMAPVALALLASVVMAAGGVGLLEQLARSDPALGVAWEQGESLGIERTSAGVSVVLDRAYMDAQRIMIAMRPDGSHAIRDYSLSIDGVALGDASAAEAHQTAQGSLSLLYRSTPPWVGPRASMVLTVHALGGPGSMQTPVTEGTWSYEFTVPNSGGSSWAGSLSDTASGVTTTLSAIRVSPTVVLGDLLFEGRALGVTSDTWSGDGVVMHDGLTLPIGGGRGKDNRFTFQTDVGVPDGTGPWFIRIDEISADSGVPNGTMLYIKGPWTFRVDVPEGPEPSRP